VRPSEPTGRAPSWPASAEELHEHDAELAAAFAAAFATEAERVAHLLDRDEPQMTRRGAWSA
jgi:predicted regulator of Ras-like GTPase activity (Roadblock/LC7/MglB family)